MKPQAMPEADFFFVAVPRQLVRQTPRLGLAPKLSG
jgi:hypothetical protein